MYSDHALILTLWILTASISISFWLCTCE